MAIAAIGAWAGARGVIAVGQHQLHDWFWDPQQEWLAARLRVGGKATTGSPPSTLLFPTPLARMPSLRAF
jgi:hypothetical protein